MMLPQSRQFSIEKTMRWIFPHSGRRRTFFTCSLLEKLFSPMRYEKLRVKVNADEKFKRAGSGKRRGEVCLLWCSWMWHSRFTLQRFVKIAQSASSLLTSRIHVAREWKFLFTSLRSEKLKKKKEMLMKIAFANVARATRTPTERMLLKV